jgi:hypothetical protein
LPFCFSRGPALEVIRVEAAGVPVDVVGRDPDERPARRRLFRGLAQGFLPRREVCARAPQELLNSLE